MFHVKHDVRCFCMSAGDRNFEATSHNSSGVAGCVHMADRSRELQANLEAKKSPSASYRAFDQHFTPLSSSSFFAVRNSGMNFIMYKAYSWRLAVQKLAELIYHERQAGWRINRQRTQEIGNERTKCVSSFMLLDTRQNLHVMVLVQCPAPLASSQRKP